MNAEDIYGRLYGHYHRMCGLDCLNEWMRSEKKAEFLVQHLTYHSAISLAVISWRLPVFSRSLLCSFVYSFAHSFTSMLNIITSKYKCCTESNSKTWAKVFIAWLQHRQRAARITSNQMGNSFIFFYEFGHDWSTKTQTMGQPSQALMSILSRFVLIINTSVVLNIGTKFNARWWLLYRLYRTLCNAFNYILNTPARTPCTLIVTFNRIKRPMDNPSFTNHFQ